MATREHQITAKVSSDSLRPDSKCGGREAEVAKEPEDAEFAKGPEDAAVEFNGEAPAADANGLLTKSIQPQQHRTCWQRLRRIAPNTPRTSVVTPPKIARISAVLPTTLPIFLRAR